MKTWLIDQIKAEPVAAQAIVQSFLGVAMSFGMGLTPDQMASILVLSSAVLAFITRRHVTPNVKIGTGTGTGGN